MVIVLFLTAFFSQAQESSQNDLELKRRALLQEIQLTTHLLSQIRKEKEVSLNQFLLLEKQIKQREELVWGIQRDIQSTQMRIGKLKKEIEYNEDRYRELIEQYTTFLQASYRLSLQQNKWVFIFSTASINQIFQRWRYLSRLKNASFNQFSLLQSLQDSLVQRKSILERRKEEQTGLMLSQNDQKTLLARDLSIKQQTLNRLNQDEKGLSSNLKKQMSEQERLNAEIRKIIDAKMRESGAKAELPETPESLRLSADFESNKGNLPWPVSRGILVKSYGQQRHPTLKNVTTLNNGINIQVELKTPVKAVFKGKVIDLRFIPGFHMVVMLRHGTYYTVYALLEEVVVSVGDLVENGQLLGTAQTNTETGLAEIHFEIWKQKELVNPETWLKTK